MRKQKILSAAEKLECDPNEDYIYYKGKVYVVDLTNKIVCKLKIINDDSVPKKLKKKIVCKVVMKKPEETNND